MSWCAGDESGAKLLPSFVVERIRKLFPQVEIQREDGAYRCGLPAAALALAGQRPGGALWRYFEVHGQGGTLEKMAAARAMGRGRLSPGAVRSLYGSTLAMSASRLDQVKSCHFGYFMEYGLKARPRKPAGFQAPEYGTFVQAKEGALSIKPDISRLTLLTSGRQERFTFRQGIEIMMKKEKENKNL